MQACEQRQLLAWVLLSVPHAQRRVVPRTGRILVLASPAGFEGFFRDLAEADRAGVIGPDSYASASENYAITWLG